MLIENQPNPIRVKNPTQYLVGAPTIPLFPMIFHASLVSKQFPRPLDFPRCPGRGVGIFSNTKMRL